MKINFCQIDFFILQFQAISCNTFQNTQECSDDEYIPQARRNKSDLKITEMWFMRLENNPELKFLKLASKRKLQSYDTNYDASYDTSFFL